MFLKLFLASVCLALLPEAARADTIHVSTSGSADGPGTAELPFDRLESALGRVWAGDTVLIHGGTYLKTRAVVALAGTAAAPITIKAAPGEHVVLDGKDAFGSDPREAEDKSRIGAVIDLRNSRYVSVEGIEIANSPGFGVSTWESEYLAVRGMKIHDCYSRGLGGSGAHLLFENNEIFNAAMSNENEAVFNGKVSYWSAAAATWYRAGGALSTDVTWRGNKIHDSWGEGLIALHVDGAVIEKNEIYDNYSVLLYIDHSRNVRVDANHIYHLSRRLIRRDIGDTSPAILFAAESYRGTPQILLENLVIVNNLIAKAQVGVGFWRDPSNTSPTNRYCNVEITGNSLSGISVLPVSLHKIEPLGLGPCRNILANNLIYRVPDTQAMRLGNPELWQLTHNDIIDRPIGIRQERE